MHAKTVLIDDRAAVTGSVNLSQNGFNNYHEHLIVSDDPAVVTPLLTDFERCWTEGREVGQAEMDANEVKDSVKQQTREDKKGNRGNYKSRKDEHVRELEGEFDGAVDEKGKVPPPPSTIPPTKINTKPNRGNKKGEAS